MDLKILKKRHQMKLLFENNLNLILFYNSQNYKISNFFIVYKAVFNLKFPVGNKLHKNHELNVRN